MKVGTGSNRSLHMYQREELRQAMVGTTCTSHLDLGLKLL